jgi:hypothetical protein
MSNKLSRDAARVSGTTRKDEDKCPLCGAAVHYRGLTGLECAGSAGGWVASRAAYLLSDCPNYKAPPPAPEPELSLEDLEAMVTQELKNMYPRWIP